MSLAATAATVSAALSTLIVVFMLVWLIRRVFRTKRVAGAAMSLIDIHMADLDGKLATMADQNEDLAEEAARLSTSLGELRDSLETISYLTGAIPKERSQLRKVVLDLVLPTNDQDPDDGSRTHARA